MSFMRPWTFVFWSILGLTACSSGTGEKGKPPAIGRINEVVVVCDPSIWEGALADTFSYYFEGPYPLLPQPEPLFDIKSYSYEEITQKTVREEYRNLILLCIGKDTNSLGTRFVRSRFGEGSLKEPGVRRITDVWAKGQQVFLISGGNIDELIRQVTLAFPTLADRIHEFDTPLIRNTAFFPGRGKNLEANLEKNLGIRMEIPSDFVQAKMTQNLAWFRRETNEASINFMVHTLPYRDERQLDKFYLIALRDTLGKLVTSETPGSHMVTHTRDLPVLTQVIRMQNRYTLEARGLWEMDQDFMGGPFVTFLICDPSRKRLIYLDGFVFAPTENKRNYIQFLEYILKTIRLDPA